VAGKNQHVVPHNGGWAVKGAGNQKATIITKTQKEAESIAKEIAKNQHSELLVHRKDGRIRSKDSFGDDNCPPQDREH
jgi:hypothetical protein